MGDHVAIDDVGSTKVRFCDDGELTIHDCADSGAKKCVISRRRARARRVR